MRRLLVILLSAVALTPCSALKSSQVITGYLINDDYPRFAFYDVSHSKANVANGEYISFEKTFGEWIELFAWEFKGNIYPYSATSSWRSESYDTVTVGYSIAPLKNSSSGSLLPYSFWFDSDYTYIGAVSLENSAKVGKIKKLKDTISVEVDGDSVSDSIDVAGSFSEDDASNRSIIYKYTMSGDPGKDYFWSRKGKIFVSIDEDDYNAADKGTYRSSITVTISKE